MSNNTSNSSNPNQKARFFGEFAIPNYESLSQGEVPVSVESAPRITPSVYRADLQAAAETQEVRSARQAEALKTRAIAEVGANLAALRDNAEASQMRLGDDQTNQSNWLMDITSNGDDYNVAS